MLVEHQLDRKIQELLALVGRYVAAGEIANASLLACAIREIEKARKRDREDPMDLATTNQRYGVSIRHLRRLVGVEEIPNRAESPEDPPQLWPIDVERWLLAPKQGGPRPLRIAEPEETEEDSEVKVTVIGPWAEGGRHAA